MTVVNVLEVKVSSAAVHGRGRNSKLPDVTMHADADSDAEVADDDAEACGGFITLAVADTNAERRTLMQTLAKVKYKKGSFLASFEIRSCKMFRTLVPNVPREIR